MPFSTSTLDEQAGGAPEPVGQQLKALREGKGLSVQDVAAATNMPPETIEAIEAGTILETAAPTYARGFVRIYADFLEADVERIIEEFDRVCRPQRARLYVRGVGAMSHKDYRPSRRRGRRSPALALSVVLLVLIALAALAYVYVHLDEWLGQKTKPPTPSAPPHPDQTAPPVVTPDTGGQTPPAAARYVLRVTAVQNAWIKAEVDGEVVFNTVLAKGKSEQWGGSHSVRIELRDPTGVHLLKDGQPITNELGPGPTTITYGEDGFNVASGAPEPAETPDTPE
jgi:cytoskeleton protein RodZ